MEQAHAERIRRDGVVDGRNSSLLLIGQCRARLADDRLLRAQLVPIGNALLFSVGLAEKALSHQPVAGGGAELHGFEDVGAG